MFIVDTNKEKATYTCPVTVGKPVDGGRFQKGTFTAEFKYLEQDEIDEVLENAQHGRDNGNLAASALVGWKADLVDGNKQPLVYSDEVKEALLKVPYIRGAVIDAFVKSISGEGARRKN